jgi:hypothetical protein
MQWLQDLGNQLQAIFRSTANDKCSVVNIKCSEDGKSYMKAIFECYGSTDTVVMKEVILLARLVG